MGWKYPPCCFGAYQISEFVPHGVKCHAGSRVSADDQAHDNKEESG